MGRLQSWRGRFGGKKNVLPLRLIKPHFLGAAALSLVTIPTMIFSYIKIKYLKKTILKEKNTTENMRKEVAVAHLK
jgi:hypothetical protein